MQRLVSIVNWATVCLKDIPSSPVHNDYTIITLEQDFTGDYYITKLSVRRLPISHNVCASTWWFRFLMTVPQSILIRDYLEAHSLSTQYHVAFVLHRVPLGATTFAIYDIHNKFVCQSSNKVCGSNFTNYNFRTKHLKCPLVIVSRLIDNQLKKLCGIDHKSL